MSTPPTLVVAHVDPRLQETLAQLFWATFPQRRLGAAGRDDDGRVVLTSDAPWGPREQRRWRDAIDGLLGHAPPLLRGLYAREVEDRRGRRFEVALPVAPSDYCGGAWVVGPFEGEGAASAWAATALARPWTFDLLELAGGCCLDVFVGDPDGATASRADA